MSHKHVVLIGERDLTKRAHAGIEASLALYRRESRRPLEFEWLQTDQVRGDTVEPLLKRATAVWCVPGSPYLSTDGALLAIRHARQHGRAFLGTCGGFQHALMEFCVDVLRRPAAHQELDAMAEHPLIIKLACSLVEVKAAVHAVPGSPYEKLMGRAISTEEFHCNYGMAPAFESSFAGSDLQFVARDESGQVRVFWHRTHPFFVGSLFQPGRTALQGTLHPLVRAFLDKA